VKQIQRYLIEHGISPSVQRLAIMDYLLKNRTHPSVSEIYADLLPAIPTLSKTTVHNTMKLFVQQKIARYIDIDERNARYDSTVEVHSHFRCNQCGCIIDVPLSETNSLFPKESDFLIDEAYVNLKGICKRCIS